jgi:hypothetical protein
MRKTRNQVLAPVNASIGVRNRQDQHPTHGRSTATWTLSSRASATNSAPIRSQGPTALTCRGPNHVAPSKSHRGGRVAHLSTNARCKLDCISHSWTTPKHVVGTNPLHNASPTVGFNSSAVSPSFERTFRHRLENRLAEVISDSSNDRKERRSQYLALCMRWITASLRVRFAPLLPDYSRRLERGRQQCREQSLTDL